MFTVRDRIDEAVQLLAGSSDTPRADAEFLMAHLLGVPRSRLAMYFGDVVEVPEYRIFVERRLACEPVPYILGEWEFFSVPIKTRAPVLVPRPETEHLVEVVLGWTAGAASRSGTRTNTNEHRHSSGGSPRVLELCTGTGCVAIAIAKNLARASVVATDVASEALVLTGENVELHNLGARIALRRGDLFAALLPEDGPFDIICANPPYVEDDVFPGLSPSIRLYEDPRALLAGADGLDIIRRIIANAPAHLVPGGLLALEIGDSQYGSVASLLESTGFRDIAARNDLAGIRRIAFAHS
jgi:release factor glutamine methyltransferase